MGGLHRRLSLPVGCNCAVAADNAVSGGRWGRWGLCSQGEELRVFFLEEGFPPWYVNDRTIAVLIDFADLNDDDSIGYLELSQVLECDDIIEFAALVPNKKASSQDKKDREMKIGSRGCTVGQVKDAQKLITERLINRGSGDLRQNNVRSVLAYLDTYENGMITRQEMYT